MLLPSPCRPNTSRSARPNKSTQSTGPTRPPPTRPQLTDSPHLKRRRYSEFHAIKVLFARNTEYLLRFRGAGRGRGCRLRAVLGCLWRRSTTPPRGFGFISSGERATDGRRRAVRGSGCRVAIPRSNGADSLTEVRQSVLHHPRESSNGVRQARAATRPPPTTHPAPESSPHTTRGGRARDARWRLRRHPLPGAPTELLACERRARA